ncbi:MAG: Rha family transcriptional regulator [Peptostreptococcaceae bacterium]|nr:Rha family transcriptional regulator [Peptostreptococcaceae bacterium]
MELVKIENNKDHGLVVSSRVIAERLGRLHKDVLAGIDIIAKSSTAEISALFIQSRYKAKNGKMNREYLLTKDGFTLYMFNIQGYVDFKMAYINRFNEMEKALNERVLPSPQKNEIEQLTFFPKTYNGKPVMAVHDLRLITKKNQITIDSFLIDNGFARCLLIGEELEQYKKENPWVSKYTSNLYLLPYDVVRAVLRKMGFWELYQPQVDEYFFSSGAEKQLCVSSSIVSEDTYENLNVVLSMMSLILASKKPIDNQRRTLVTVEKFLIDLREELR